MGFSDFLGGIGGDLIVAGAGLVGTALLGPAGGAILGGAVGGAVAWGSGKTTEEILTGMAMGAAGGAMGGMGGIGIKGALRSGKAVQLADEIGRTAAANAGSGAAKLLPKIAQSQNGLLRHTIPVAVGGAHQQAWKTYLHGGLTFGSTWFSYASGRAMTPDPTQVSGDEQYALAQIPVIPIAQERSPEEMPTIYMPDPQGMPEGLVFSPPVQQQYEDVIPVLLIGNWEACGDRTRVRTLLPPDPPVSDISGEEMANINNYAQRVAAMRSKWEEMSANAELIPEIDESTQELALACQDMVGASVEALGTFATFHPANVDLIVEYQTRCMESGSFILEDLALINAAEPTEDNYVFTLIESSVVTSEENMRMFAGEFEALAAEVPEESEEEQNRQTDTGTENLLDREYANESSQLEDLAQLTPPAAWDLGGPALDATTTTGRTAEESGSLGQRSADRTGAQSDALQAGSQVPAVAGTPGSGLESMALPAAINALMNANQQPGRTPDAGEPVNRRSETGRPKEDQTAATTPTTLSPTTQTPAASTPQQSTASAPARSVVARPAGPSEVTLVSARKEPGPQEAIVYTFPDGRTQEVAVVVAQALDAAFDNAAGTDARAAYARTVVKWNREEASGSRIDPHQVMTGDVAAWDGRSAILVAFETDTSATLEVVVDGELRPFVGEMTDKAGDFGAFAGFFHPVGIEVQVSARETPDTALPIDQTTAAVAAAPA
ncbi:hypothetical protein [Nocardia flavorosea]|uniref:Uncharacterized protein n=1 Tax=Nocardia flavorosea TaxID=53429 RepID=A0A846YLE3_9NOCA|nr:hypothetical protein [Nocardia flavorosea]NKY59815.1 hypothetical protein [Nocardia flavorosea]